MLPEIPSFTLLHTLTRHTKPISVLSISPDGRFLLSGSDDAIAIVWDIDAGSDVQTFAVLFNGPISSGTWLEVGKDRAICFGCADGTIHIYRQGALSYDFASLTVAHDGPVDSLAFDSNYNRIASAGAGTLRVWDVENRGTLTSLASSPQRPFRAVTVIFFDKGCAVMVCFAEPHNAVAYTVEPWEMRWSEQLPTRIGRAALSPDNRTLVVSNLVNGVDTYTMPPRQPIRSFNHAICENRCLQVSSALQGALTIAGSDDGCVRLFEQRTGQLRDQLPHGSVRTLVQAVASYSDERSCIIASGSSDPDSIVTIKIWMGDLSTQGSSIVHRSKGPSMSSWQICVLVFAMSIFVQTIVLRSPLDQLNSLKFYIVHIFRVLDVSATNTASVVHPVRSDTTSSNTTSS